MIDAVESSPMTQALTMNPESISASSLEDQQARPALLPALHALEELRSELDSIDARLLQDVHARLACCVRIGRHKREHAIPMMQPHRIGFVQERARAFAAEHGLNAAFLRELYELVIAETCRLEDEIIAAPEAGA